MEKYHYYLPRKQIKKITLCNIYIYIFLCSEITICLTPITLRYAKETEMFKISVIIFIFHNRNVFKWKLLFSATVLGDYERNTSSNIFFESELIWHLNIPSSQCCTLLNYDFCHQAVQTSLGQSRISIILWPRYISCFYH